MASLPGWDSIETTGALHDFFELGGIILFLIVVGFELLAYFYGHRKDDLVAIAQQSAAQQAHQNQDFLKSQLAEANHKVLNLEAQQVARRLRPDQITALVTALSPFAGQKVEIWCSVSSSDCNGFAVDFQSAFRQANWIPSPISFGTADYDVIGIEPIVNDALIAAPPNTPPIPAVSALAAVLHQLGLTKTEAVNRHPSVSTETILIRIGRVPLS